MKVSYNKLVFGCFLLLVWIFPGCNDNTPYIFLEGTTMGTTYHMTIQSNHAIDLKKEIDSILLEFNMNLSTYIDSSVISRFNSSENGISYDASVREDFLGEMMTLSAEVYQKTGGAFDPTVMPLVNYYGFGYKESNRITKSDQKVIDSLLAFVGFHKVNYQRFENGAHLNKDLPGVELDFSSIAKGYGVDVISSYLEEIGINNYLVEIGGESRAKGVNPHGRIWSIGINVPDPNAPVNDYLFPISLKDLAVATSGNYRNFYTSDSVTFVHIIDPVTGESKPSDILSSTIIAKECAVADAYATATIVMGSEKALRLIESIDGVEACFILSRDGDFQLLYSSGFKNYINE